MPKRTKSSRKRNLNRNHKPNSDPSYITISRKNGLTSEAKMLVPVNRAARRQYRRTEGHEVTLPPILMPYRKDQSQNVGSKNFKKVA